MKKTKAKSKTKEKEELKGPRNGAMDPIRSLEDIERIKKTLSGNARDRLLFTMGINCGLRIGDLLKFKVGQVRNLKVGQSIGIKEQKTGKQNTLTMNKAVRKALDDYLKEYDREDDMVLFFSRKGEKALTRESVHALVNKWCAGAKVKGNFGAHTLRKTFGFTHRYHFGTDISIIAERFNHSSVAVTKRYLGVSGDEVTKACLRDI